MSIGFEVVLIGSFVCYSVKWSGVFGRGVIWVDVVAWFRVPELLLSFSKSSGGVMAS